MIKLADKIQLLKVFFTSDNITDKEFAKYAKTQREHIIKKKALVKFREVISKES